MKGDWIKGVDTNTAYFHACLKKRRSHNQSYKLKDVTGVRADDQKSLEDAFLQYYDGLLGQQ